MVACVLAAIAVPIAGAWLTLLAPRTKRVSWLYPLAATAASLVLMVWFAAAGRVPVTRGLVRIGDTLVFGVTIDTLSVLIGFAVIFIGFLVVLYSAGYLAPGNREHPVVRSSRYDFFLLTFIGAMAGVVFSSTMVGMLVFFEVTGLCSWGLIGYYDKPKALRAALKAIVVTHVASIGLYLATAILFAATGSFALTGLASVSDPLKIAICGGVLVAAWGKSAQFPFQFWLPDAMEAPTPISAYLHAASMVKVGVYIFARTLFSAGHVPNIIGVVGSIMAIVTLIYGFLMYFPQRDIKRLLAYSTITQLSYIFLALSLSVFGSQLAFNGGIAHIFNHSFAKGLFFLVAGALSYATGTRLLPSLRGLLSRMPLLGIAFAVAVLAVTGVPPFSGFYSKFAIFAGGFEASRHTLLALPLVLVAIAESVGCFAWFLKWFGAVVPGKPSNEVALAGPVPRVMQGVLVTLVVMTLVSGLVASAWLG